MQKERKPIVVHGTCAHCGRRHRWRWPPEDIMEGEINMECARCGEYTVCVMGAWGYCVNRARVMP